MFHGQNQQRSLVMTWSFLKCDSGDSALRCPMYPSIPVSLKDKQGQCICPFSLGRDIIAYSYYTHYVYKSKLL